jgi:hypothetical protein
MDEKTARSLAHDLVKHFLEPVVFSSKAAKYSPLTIAELIYVGAYFTRSMVEFGFDPLDREVYSMFATFPPDLPRIEEFLYRRILAGKENPDEMLKAMKGIKGLSETPGVYRRVFLGMAKDAIPPGKRGRRRKIEEKDLPVLGARSDDLIPAVLAFVAYRKQSTKRTTAEILEFLGADFPKQCEFLTAYQGQLDKLLQDQKFLRTAKTPRARVRMISDVIAGAEFDLKPSYAVRRAKEARRGKNRLKANETKLK